jgi:putative Ca2+/H+ antiporter (TMEM165/GDT1 family)
MWEAFLRAFILVLLMEMCSSSQIILATIVAHSQHQIMTWFGGLVALLLTCTMAFKAGQYLASTELPTNLISGIILITTGVILLWKS